MSTTAIRIRQTAVEEDDAAIGSAADLSGKKKRDKVLLLELPGNGGDRDLRRLGTVHHVDVSFYI